MIHFHFTKLFLNQNKNNSQILDIIENFFKENKSMSTIKGIGKISSFTKSIYVLRNKTPYFEIILEEKVLNIENHKVVVYFVRALKNIKNSLQDYVDIRDGKWIDKYPFDHEDEIDFISNLNTERDDDNDKLAKIPQALINWQNDYKLNVNYDIYESDLWVNYAVNSSPKDGMSIEDNKLFFNSLKKVIHHKDIGVIQYEKDNVQFYELIDTDFNIAIYYIIVNIEDKSYTILYGGCNVNNQLEYHQTIQKTFKEKYGNEFKNLQNISEFCLKAYPSWSLKDYEIWIKIQKNREFGNLSLLPEQTNFLENFTFPKYINGQAGSGKSTILYYLFSNIYYYKCAGEITGDIIFITENKKLLGYTVDSIYDLILNNPEFQLTSEDTDLTNLKRNFHSFKDFLQSYLTESKDFDDDKYLDFSKFKILYSDSAITNAIKRKFSAEFVWFIITTYIYGLDINQILSVQNYDELMPKEGKDIISKEDFKTLENEIVKPFYKKLITEEKYWNKITLIKFIKENRLDKKKFEVIFCDESQDFSKVELEFLISLSLYSNYNLQDVSQYPIVFAGDALQTVNPTGFRSEVLTSMIYQSLTNSQIGFKLNQRDLIFTPEFNYRSSSSIVSIANVIQNWRKLDLKEDIKDFQKPKRKDTYKNQNLNIFIDLQYFSADFQLQKKIEYKTIIVPVNNDEIENYINKYPILKEFNNIISSVDAKGLDFSEVVIFGFGSHYAECDFGIYEKKFFYNKLYVAITRSRDELIIIDSTSSKTEFWDKMILSYIDTEWNQTKNHIQSIDDLLISDAATVIESREYIIEEDAKNQKDIGWINKNVPLLKIASNHFLKIGNYEEYYICLGLVEELNEKYRDASNYYLRKELTNNSEAKNKALYALWNGKYYEEIISLSSVDGVEKKVIDVLCTIYISKDKVFDESDIEILENNLKILLKVRKNTVALDSFKQLFIDNILNNYQSELNYRIYELLNDSFGDLISNEERLLIADNLYENNQINLAINIYDYINIKEINYYRAKASLAKKRRKHEDVVIYLGKIIYEDFAKNKSFDIDKKEIAKELIDYVIDNDLADFKNPVDPYFFGYIFLSKLYYNDYEINLEEYEIFKSILSVEDRKLELLSFYYYILNENQFESTIYNRVILDWSELYRAEYSIDELNKEYQILCKIKDIPYSEFSENDFKGFNTHLTYIKVENFKQFKELEISNIGLINLIVGDNNIGKTSALEMLLISLDHEEYYKRLLCSYIERSKTIPDKQRSSEKIEYFFEIDKKFLNDFVSESGVGNPIFKFTTGKFIHKINVVINENFDDVLGYKNYKFNNIKKRLDILYLEEMMNNPMYTYGKGYGKDLSVFYDNYIRKSRDLERDFFENLQLFIPHIENVLIDSDGEINIRVHNQNSDLPLYNFGDGANKLFRILILLTIHKGKLVLIDEIDSGIHFSRFGKFWKIIISIATRDNTQIIATTHNLECINYFRLAIDEPTRKDTRVIQLIKTNRIKSSTYIYEDFSLALEDDIELRG